MFNGNITVGIVESHWIPSSYQHPLRPERIKFKIDREHTGHLVCRYPQQLGVPRLPVPDVAAVGRVHVGPVRGDDSPVIPQRETVRSVLLHILEEGDHTVCVNLEMRVCGQNVFSDENLINPINSSIVCLAKQYKTDNQPITKRFEWRFSW